MSERERAAPSWATKGVSSLERAHSKKKSEKSRRFLDEKNSKLFFASSKKEEHSKRRRRRRALSVLFLLELSLSDDAAIDRVSSDQKDREETEN